MNTFFEQRKKSRFYILYVINEIISYENIEKKEDIFYIKCGNNGIEQLTSYLLTMKEIPNEYFIFLSLYLLKFHKNVKPGFITCFNIQLIFICGLLLIWKFLDDKPPLYLNKIFSKILKINISKINEAEIEFFKILDYSIFISNEEIENIKIEFEKFQI